MTTFVVACYQSHKYRMDKISSLVIIQAVLKLKYYCLEF